jgi:hypothetical protein
MAYAKASNTTLNTGITCELNQWECFTQ